MTRRTDRYRGGYFLLDLAIGVALVGVLLAVLAAANTQNRRAAIALAQQREALRDAERALVSLRLGETPAEVAVAPLPTDAPAGWRWVRVTAAYERGEVSLDGLVPAAGEAQP